MPTQIIETYNSRSFRKGKDSEDGTIIYYVKGSDEVTDIRTKVIATAPATFPDTTSLVRGDINCMPLGGGSWSVTVAYVPDYAPLLPAVGIPGPPTPVLPLPGATEPLKADIAFDLTGQTEHITQSLETVSKKGRTGFPDPPPDLKRAIGLTADGQVLGCDKIKPYLELSISRTFESITFDYIKILRSLVGKLNNNTFASFPEGNVLFVGAVGNTKDGFKTVVTFKFLVQEDRTDISICDGLVVASKKAWDFLWVSYKNVEAGGFLTQNPVAAYVERIYEKDDFSKLAIGT